MNELAPLDAYGELIEPTTLKIQRLLPGPIERVWAYLTQSELRRQWLASGDMQMKAGSDVRAHVAQRRAHRSARQAPGRLRRRAQHGEPRHRSSIRRTSSPTRSASTAR